MPLPAGFGFGVATSGFQIEGGYNRPGHPANNWSDWEHAGGRRRSGHAGGRRRSGHAGGRRRSGHAGRVPTAGRALDFWNRYEEVLDRAAAAGCNSFRLSVEWARCEPSPGQLDDDAFDRYRAILEACQRRGMEPVVALHHFTHPHWLGPGFWLDLRAPDRFAAWAGSAVERLAGGCRHWLTSNEINVLAFQSWFTGGFPPGKRGRTGDTVRALGHLLAGHVLAYRAIHLRQPEAVVSTNNHCLSVYELDRLLVDVLLGRSHGVARHDLGDWLAQRRGAFHAALPAPTRVERGLRRVAASILPLDQALPRAVSEVYAGPDPRPLDVVQVNYFNPVVADRVGLPGRRTVGGSSVSLFRQIWDDPVDPEGLARYCRLNHEPGLELWVAENGMCNRVRPGHGHDHADPRLDGWDRVRFLRATLAALARAAEAGVPVTRYYHWTLADNYEWGSYEHRFGLYRVDGGRWSDLDAFGQDAAGAYRALAHAQDDAWR